jgi:amino acid permease
VVAWTLYAAIVITSIGACSAYLVFWYYSSRPSACHPLFTESVPCPFSGNMLESVSRGKLESMYWVFILAGPLILFTWIRSFRYLAFTSIIGIVCVACHVCVVCVSCVVCGDAVLNSLLCFSTQQAILRWCWP